MKKGLKKGKLNWVHMVESPIYLWMVSIAGVVALDVPLVIKCLFERTCRKIDMKKRLMTNILIAGIMTCAGLTGCGGSDTKGGSADVPQSVSVVRRVTKNFPMVSLNSENVYDKIYEAAYSYGDVSAVSAEGTPKVVCNFNLQEPQKKIDNAKRNQIASDNTQQMILAMSEITSTTPEVDTLSSIQLSADTLHSASDETEKTMIIFDSGLSTTGLLNFAQKNIIDTPVENVVEQLKALHAIPDLTDIHVTWVGLGQVCGEQPTLTANYKHKLEELWNAILVAGNATSVEFDKSPTSGTEYAGELPKCSVVPVVADVLDVASIVTDTEMPEVMKWDEGSSVKFHGDQAVFVDQAAAEEELTPIAEYLKANPKENIYVFGMTATITGGGPGIELAEARAEAVKTLLVEKGADPAQMHCVGLGQIDNPLRVNDVDVNGRQIPELAQKNRAVFVIREDSDMVKVLLECVNNYV